MPSPWRDCTASTSRRRPRPGSWSRLASTRRARLPLRRCNGRRENRRPGRLALGIFDAGADEDDVRAVGQMRHERLGQRERAEVVRRERHVPALCVLRGAHLHDAALLSSPQSGAGARRFPPPRAARSQYPTGRTRPTPRAGLSLDCLLHLVELSAVATHQHDRAVPGQLECRVAADAGGRAGDDVCLAICSDSLAISFSLVVCLVSHSWQKNSATIATGRSNAALECLSAFAGSWTMKSIVASASAFIRADDETPAAHCASVRSRGLLQKRRRRQPSPDGEPARGSWVISSDTLRCASARRFSGYDAAQRSQSTTYGASRCGCRRLARVPQRRRRPSRF